ncbi:MAG: 23S rRNA (uracil(1939)-C(5))-methyltransferase RlmD, partial [Synergistaceae bacterium]|nr:23S rRNA (uracil(1939)-C(5))-methyltransferase RlmD [Synergistaceae bacterium]
MNPGEIVTVDISSVNSEGEGIARLESGGGKNFVVFVPGSLPGERVVCRIARVSKKYAAAAVVDILSASPDRVAPRCPSFGSCGGCRLQHASYPAQMGMKRSILADAMRRIGGIELPGGLHCEPSAKEWGYRNKAILPVGKFTGYYERRSHKIVPFEKCPVLEPSLESIVSSMISEHGRIGLKGYEESSASGDIRAIAARSGGAGGSALAGVVAAREFNRREFGALKNIHQNIMSGIPNLTGAVLNVKTSRDNFVWGPEFKSICGGKYIAAKMGNYSFDLDISSFFQINAQQAERIFSRAAEIVKSCGPSSVLELYSGVGSLTAYLASSAERVDAVEEWRPAARLMKGNMEQNGIGNVRVFVQAAERFMSDTDSLKRGSYDAIVLDPPRTGIPDAVTEG